MKILLVGEAPGRLAALTAAIIASASMGLEIETAYGVHTAQRMLRAEEYIVVVIDSAENKFIGLAERLVPRLVQYGSTLDQVIVLDYYDCRSLNSGITQLSGDDYNNVAMSINVSVAISLRPVAVAPLTPPSNVVKG